MSDKPVYTQDKLSPDPHRDGTDEYSASDSMAALLPYLEFTKILTILINNIP